GSSLAFRLQLTTNVDSITGPDSFVFSILDRTGTPIPTLDPSGVDNFLAITINSMDPMPLSYGSDPSRPPAGGGSAFDIAAPTVTLGSSVPEPSSLRSILIGAAGLGLLGLRRPTQRRPIRACEDGGDRGSPIP